MQESTSKSISSDQVNKFQSVPNKSEPNKFDVSQDLPNLKSESQTIPSIPNPKYENFALPNVSKQEIPVMDFPTNSKTIESVGSSTNSVRGDDLELSNLRNANRTLTDQVEALKAKREEDRVRLQDVERLKIQINQLEENRRLIREQTADLQRELAQLKTVQFNIKTNLIQFNLLESDFGILS